MTLPAPTQPSLLFQLTFPFSQKNEGQHLPTQVGSTGTVNISKPTLKSKVITSGFQIVLLPYLGSPHIQYGNVFPENLTHYRGTESDSAEIRHFPTVVAGAHLKCRTQLAFPRACRAL